MSPALLYNDKNECELKILGLKWDPKADVFSFDTKPSSTDPTKRSVLLNHVRVFDPLDLLSSITFWTKHVMQLLWTAGLKWDDKIPTHIAQLDPFIDENELLRVGGRLTNADIPYSHKHPLLLPCQHRLTLLLIDYHHQRLKHPGCTSLQTHLQLEFWILSVRKIIRSRIRLCISYFRTKPLAVQPKMSTLPSFRVHSDLSTECFLMAFTRFSARSGRIKELHSDCGTNFVGASRLLTPLHQFTHSKSFQDSVHHHLANHQITWQFNPSASPHFVDLWEAGVKSTNSLILWSIGLHKLTSEEFLTLLTQIKTTLNSHPLCAINNDPGDLEALTHSHFLTLNLPPRFQNQVLSINLCQSISDGASLLIYIAISGSDRRTNTSVVFNFGENGRNQVKNYSLMRLSS
ncbi:hypothetical protein QTP88_010188 [Uroleucon formosanum]